MAPHTVTHIERKRKWESARQWIEKRASTHIHRTNATVLAVFTTYFWLWLSYQSDVSLYLWAKYHTRYARNVLFSSVSDCMPRIDSDDIHVKRIPSMRSAPTNYMYTICVCWLCDSVLHSRQQIFYRSQCAHDFSVRCNLCHPVSSVFSATFTLAAPSHSCSFRCVHRKTELLIVLPFLKQSKQPSLTKQHSMDVANDGKW